MIAMRQQTPFMRTAPVLAACTAILVHSPARAEDTDVAQLAATVKSLQARLAVVEAENRQIKREMAAKPEQGRLHDNGPRRVAVASSALPAPRRVYDMVTKTSFAPAPIPSWAGAYAGAAPGSRPLRLAMVPSVDVLVPPTESLTVSTKVDVWVDLAPSQPTPNDVLHHRNGHGKLH